MKTKTTFGISFPNPELLEEAKQKSAAYGMSLSWYVNQLIRRDLGHLSMLDGHPSPRADDSLREPQAQYAAKTLAARRKKSPSNQA